jgi:hypothetical protein
MVNVSVPAVIAVGFAAVAPHAAVDQSATSVKVSIAAVELVRAAAIAPCPLSITHKRAVKIVTLNFMRTSKKLENKMGYSLERLT